MYHAVEEKLSIKGFYSLFKFYYKDNYYFAGEHHPFWELVYCSSGVIGVSADEKIYQLRKGDIIVYPPNVHHKLWSENKTEAQGLITSFVAEGEGLNEIIGAYSCDREMRSRWEELLHLMSECAQSHKTTGYLHYLENDYCKFQFVKNLFENNLLELGRKGLPLGSNQSKSALDYERIIQIMQRNLSKNLSVDELSVMCGTSVSTMKKLFRQFNSMGIHEYFLHLKMQEAVRMLNDGKTVTETSDALGFSNQSYFSTAFKRVMNISPTKLKSNEK